VATSRFFNRASNQTFHRLITSRSTGQTAYPRGMPADDPEVAARSTRVAHCWKACADSRCSPSASPPARVCSADEARDARQEIEMTRQGIERLNAMLTLRRQDLRPM
jgi:hypothetical protein